MAIEETLHLLKKVANIEASKPNGALYGRSWVSGAAGMIDKVGGHAAFWTVQKFRVMHAIEARSMTRL